MISRFHSRIDLAAVVYLVLPLALFFGRSFRLLPALVFVLLVIAGAIPLAKACLRTTETEADNNTGAWSRKALVILVIVAAVWAIFAGAGHVLYQNADWQKHNGVLTDLSRYAWPVTYGTAPDGSDVILRYYMGFHAVPAFLSKAFGVLNLWTYLWEALGVFLVLAMVLRRFQPKRRAAIGLAFIAFGGLDIVGYISLNGFSHLTPHANIDGWNLVQMNSNTTLLAWVPNHALAGWLGLLLFKDRGRDKLFMFGAPLLLVAIGFWSIFVAVGLLPFVAVPIVRQVWQSRGRYVLHYSVLAGLLLVVITASFLLSGAGSGNVHGLLWQVFPHTRVIGYAFLSLACHVLPFAIVFAIARLRFDGWTIAALIVLVLLPFYVIGVSLDFTMRASIPAQLVLFLDAAVLLNGRPESDKWKRTYHLRLAPLVAVLVIGSAASITTFVRAVFPVPTASNSGAGSASQLLTVVGNQYAPPDAQYLATMPHWLSRGLRHHQPVFNYQEVVGPQTAWVQSDGDGQANVSHQGQNLVVQLNGAGNATISSDAVLQPGIYRVRVQMTLDAVKKPGEAGLALSGHPVALPPTSALNTYVANDYISVSGAPTPLSIVIINSGSAGSLVTFSGLDAELVSRP